MLGNDIVDFSDEEAQEKHKDVRFLDRIFTDEEKSAILKAENKAELLWALWSAKEAAFKACQKQDSQIIFSPKNFKVDMDSSPPSSRKSHSDYPGPRIPLNSTPHTGTLHYREQGLDLLWSYPSTDVVHCCAVLNENTSVFTRWDEIHTLIEKISGRNNSPKSYAEQSKTIREALIHFLQKKFQMSKNINIFRPEILINGIQKKGPPILREGETPLGHYDLSLSHDKSWISAVVSESF